MKFYMLKTALFVLILCLGLVSSAQYAEEILKLTRIDQLSQFQANMVAGQISSYDRTGGNDDGFSGKYSFIREENGNLVIADLKGPGIIHRIWTPTPTEDTIQFFFDGESSPRIELKFIDLFSGNKFPFIRPVVGNEVGGYYNYVPIPYEKSLKVVFKGKRLMFIQMQYSETTPDRVKESFPGNFSASERSAMEKAADFWKKSGDNILHEIPGHPGNWQKKTQTFQLKPGSTIPIFSMKKGGRIAGIEITPAVALNTRFKDLILRARWDDEPVPAINSPLGDFFGYAFGVPSMKSLLSGVKDGVHYSYLPMPFDKKATLEIEYLKNDLNALGEIPVTITIYYSDQKRSADEGKLYVEWRRENNPPLGEPYLLLKKQGRGHHVGTLLQSQGLNSGMTLFFEGDDQCFIDGELRLHGTGSEDYFNGGWYALADRWDQAFSLPVHGSLDYSIALARTGGYRFLITDKLSFGKDFLLTMEHGGENNSVPVDYASVVFYYCDTPPETNTLPAVDLLKPIESPDLMEYWVQLLPIQALSHGARLSHTNVRLSPDGPRHDVYRVEAPSNGFAKFELEVPSDGDYKLYISYLKGPECGTFDVNQRQIPIKTGINGYAPAYTFVEKEFIGDMHIEKGTNTITMMLKDKPEHAETNTFLLQRVYLEKSKK